MSATTEESSTSTTGDFFQSFGAMRKAHADLLKQHTSDLPAPEVIAEIVDFLARSSATGVFLDDEDERQIAQSMLDYWATVLYRARATPPDTLLHDFDPARAPTIPDEAVPYCGLDAFHESSHDMFFGRQRLIDGMIERLRTERMLVVSGSSGSGKSSLVRAGLLPTLKSGTPLNSGEWRYMPVIIPGSDPVGALARSMAALVPEENAAQKIADDMRASDGALAALVKREAGRPVVLIVDQFEEVFTLCETPSDQRVFIDNLLALADAPERNDLVILTMRVDFESFVQRIPELQAVYSRGRVEISAMNAAELREAIELPAQRIGLKFEAGVVDALLLEILGQPAALPLLQFTLLKLWEKRDHNRITWDAYQAIGGPLKALARSADTFYDTLLKEDQEAARRILLRLVRPDGVEVMSSRVKRAALYRGGEAMDRVERVLQKLVEARLVRLTPGDTPADDQVEVAHEALVRNWPRLAVDWLAEQRVAIAIRRRLEAQAREWVRLGRSSSGMLDDVQLTEAERWVHSSEASDLGYDETLDDLLHASRAAIEERTRQQRRRRQFQLIGSSAIAAVVITVLVIALFFTFAKNKELTAKQNDLIDTQNKLRENAKALEQNNADMAKQNQQLFHAQTESAARGLALQAQLLKESQYDLSLLLSTEALTSTHTVDTESGLIANFVSGPPITKFLRGHTASIVGAALNPDGTLLATIDRTGWVRLWNTADYSPHGQPFKAFDGDSNTSVAMLAFGPYENTLVVGSNSRVDGSNSSKVQLWKIAGVPRVCEAWENRSAVAVAAAVSATPERLVAIGDESGQISVWHLPRELKLCPTALDDGEIANKRRNQSGFPSMPIQFDNLADGSIKDITFSPDSVLISISGPDNPYSPDGQNSPDGQDKYTLQRWSVGKEALVSPPQPDLLPFPADLIKQKHFITRVKLAPNGNRMVLVLNDGSIEVHNTNAITDTNQIYTLPKRPGEFTALVFSPNGTRLATGSSDKSAVVWDIATQKMVQQINHGGAVNALAISKDNTTLISGGEDARVGEDASVIVTDLGGSSSIVQTFGSRSTDELGRNKMAVFSPDGKTVAIAGGSPKIVLADAITLQPLGDPFVGPNTDFNAVAFSPDGKTLAGGAADGQIFQWDVSTRRIHAAPLQASNGFVWSLAFNPSGTLLASSDGDGLVAVWDLATRVQRQQIKQETWVNRVLFSADGKFLITASDDKTIKEWDVIRPALKATRVITFDAGVNEIALAPNGDTLAAVVGSGISFWNWRTGGPIGDIGTSSGAIFGLAWSNDGRYLASAGSDTNTTLWEVAEVAGVVMGKQLGLAMPHHSQVRHVAFSPDNQTLVSSGDDLTTMLWHVPDQKLLARRKSDQFDHINVLALSPNGTALAVGTDKQQTILFDPTSSGKIVPFSYAASGASVTGLAWSPDGGLLATSDLSGTLLLRNIAGVTVAQQEQPGFSLGPIAWSSSQVLAVGECEGEESPCSAPGSVALYDVSRHNLVPLSQIPMEESGLPRSMTFRPDGTLLAISSSEGRFLLWNTERREKMTLAPILQGAPTYAMAFSPDGRMLVTGGDGEARLWNPDTQQMIRQISTNGYSPLSQIAFNRNGQLLALGNETGDVSIWNVETGKQWGTTLSRHSDMVSGLAFSNNQRLISSSRDGTLNIWTLNITDLQKAVCDIVGRNITWQEWDQYFGNELYHKTCENLPVHPSYVRHFITLGDERAAQKDLQGAIKQYRNAHNLNPSMLPDPESAARTNVANELIKEAHAAAISATFTNTLGLLQQAHAISSTAVLTPEIEARNILFQSARDLIEGGKVSDALPLLERAQAHYSNAQERSDAAVELQHMAQSTAANTGSITDTTALLEMTAVYSPTLVRDPDVTALVYVLDQQISSGDLIASEQRLAELIDSYSRVLQSHLETMLSDEALGRLCARGTMKGYGARVLSACDEYIKRVQPASKQQELAFYYLCRGVGRAQTGDMDGAVGDVRTAQQSIEEVQLASRLPDWIAALQHGRNPFDEATLGALSP